MNKKIIMAAVLAATFSVSSLLAADAVTTTTPVTTKEAAKVAPKNAGTPAETENNEAEGVQAEAEVKK
jgi:hypothetical protein